MGDSIVAGGAGIAGVGGAATPGSKAGGRIVLTGASRDGGGALLPFRVDGNDVAARGDGG